MQSDVTKQELIGSVFEERPHVVLLGAGASRAVCPHGDKNGKKLPVMADFIDVLDLRTLIDSLDLNVPTDNFEEIYSILYACEDFADPRKEMERRIYDYFADLELPNHPTIYDYLILSLRPKDTIATFNWDPLLLQALVRCAQHCPVTLPVFLHGNVSVGACLKDYTCGHNGSKCKKCGVNFQPTDLLYPITEKHYEKNPFIKSQWETLKDAMGVACMFTVFGYGAPASDIAAIQLLQEGWGPGHERKMEELEFVDLKSKEELEEAWRPFIHSHHFGCMDNFFESDLALFPRRTGEAWKFRFFSARFVSDNPAPRDVTLWELFEWHKELSDVEPKD